MKFIRKHLIPLCVVLLLIVFASISLYNVRKLYIAEQKFSEYHFQNLFAAIENSIQDETQATEDIVDAAVPIIKNTDALRAFLVYSSKNGIEYLRATSDRYIITDNINLANAKVRLDANNELLYSNTFYTPRGTVFFVEAVYRSVDSRQLQELIRSILIGMLTLGVFLTTVFIIRLLFFTSEQREMRAVRAAAKAAERREEKMRRAEEKMATKTNIQEQQENWEEELSAPLDAQAESENISEETRANILTALEEVHMESPDSRDGFSAFDFANEVHLSPEFDTTNINKENEELDIDDDFNIDEAASSDNDVDFYENDAPEENTYSITEAELRKNLAVELQRSVFYDYNLSLLVIYASSDELDKISEIVNSFVPLPEFLFRTQDTAYTLILPQSGVQDTLKFAHRLLDGLRTGVDNISINMGTSSQNKRLIDSKTLIQEAHTALEKAQAEGKEILAFSPDPEQYRKHLRRISGMDVKAEKEEHTFIFEDLAETKAPDVEVLLMEEAGNETMVPRF